MKRGLRKLSLFGFGQEKGRKNSDIFIYLEDCPGAQGIDMVYEGRTGTSSWETFQG